MLKKAKWLLVTGCILALTVFLLAGCGGQGQKAGDQKSSDLSGSITAVGSTALLPMVKEGSKQFMGKN
ncbi:MAG: phosphate-binding protein, partial [Desulfocucumaceae bacterium]